MTSKILKLTESVYAHKLCVSHNYTNPLETQFTSMNIQENMFLKNCKIHVGLYQKRPAKCPIYIKAEIACKVFVNIFQYQSL